MRSLKPLEFIENHLSHSVHSKDKKQVMDEIAGCIAGFIACGYLSELEIKQAHELLDQYIQYSIDSIDDDFA